MKNYSNVGSLLWAVTLSADIFTHNIEPLSLNSRDNHLNSSYKKAYCDYDSCQLCAKYWRYQYNNREYYGKYSNTYKECFFTSSMLTGETIDNSCEATEQEGKSNKVNYDITGSHGVRRCYTTKYHHEDSKTNVCPSRPAR